MANQDIDFVITWVDGNDPLWQEEKNRYLSGTKKADNSSQRYRDWDLLRYWFRGVEKFVPWVKKIHFVTWGHLPSWLNIHHEKLNIVKHSDFIPAQYLPTFNSNAIELFMHKIPSLAEQFVYFNDDVLVINKLQPEDFFRNGLTCDVAVLGAVLPQDELVTHTIYNNVKIINRYFCKTDLTIKQWRKVLCLCYGKLLLRSICLYPFSKHTGFYDPHLALPFTKTLFDEVWDKAPNELTDTCEHRFRISSDYSIWLMRYWRLAQGAFVPHAPYGKYFEIGDPKMLAYVKKQKGKMVCCNDVREDLDFILYKQKLDTAFSFILPNKSKFEI